MSDSGVLARLTEVIRQRKLDRPSGSYTTLLLDGGIERIGAKLVEETNELILAGRQLQENGAGGIVAEAADLMYHLLVLLAFCDRDLHDVEAELGRRFGVSGLEEKAARRGASPDG